MCLVFLGCLRCSLVWLVTCCVWLFAFDGLVSCGFLAGLLDASLWYGRFLVVWMVLVLLGVWLVTGLAIAIFLV